MLVDGEKHDLGDKVYLLSPQDLAAYELIQPLIEAGVISFKIEGRLKGGPYVAATTQTYRTAIDAALAHRAFKPARKDELDLAQTFSRGLTHGFLDGNDHQKLVRGRFPKSRGVRLGKVTGFSKRGVMIVLVEKLPVEELVRPGDGVLFDLGTPEANEPGGRVQAKSATNVELGFEAGSVDFGRIPVGCEVWKTDDPELKKRLTQTYSQDRTVRRERVTAVLGGTLGGAVALALSTDSGLSAPATWPGPLEVATKRPTTPDDLREQLGRLGDTPFELGDLLVNLPAGVMLPRSVTNDLRRQAAGALAEKREAGRKHRLSPSPLAEGGSSHLPSLRGGRREEAGGSLRSTLRTLPSRLLRHRPPLSEGRCFNPPRWTVTTETGKRSAPPPIQLPHDRGEDGAATHPARPYRGAARSGPAA